MINYQTTSREITSNRARFSLISHSSNAVNIPQQLFFSFCFFFTHTNLGPPPPPSRDTSQNLGKFRDVVADHEPATTVTVLDRNERLESKGLSKVHTRQTR